MRQKDNRMLPLGALAAGFGVLGLPALAQAQAAAPLPAAAASAPTGQRAEATLPGLSVKAKIENDANSVRATTTTIGKGTQELRDIPQSITVITEKILDDRRVDTLKQALHQTGGVSFMAAEGGEEDVRLRGFSLATSGDIYVDGLRDPAFYDRDTFSYDRVELLRGSASMLFGRGSTGGVVNQVHKQAFLTDANEISFTLGDGQFYRVTGDFNKKLGDSSALRVNLMGNQADNWGNRIDKQGLAINYRAGVGSNDELSLSGYYLHNDNGINYGLPWLRVSSTQTSANPSTLIPGLNPKVYYGAASDYNAGGAQYLTAAWTHRLGDGGELKSTLRYGQYDRDQRASTIRFCVAPTCPGFTAPGAEGPTLVTGATPITRGTNNKIQNMDTTYGQVDYSKRFKWFGVDNEVLSGLDLAHEEFRGYAAVLPTGVTLDKNAVRTRFGAPNDGTGGVDEALRIKRQQAAFDAKSIGLYGQDLVQVAEHWKLLGGLRYDHFKGSYQSIQAAANATLPVGTITADRGRSEGLWSKRFGALFQPSDTMSYHFSYGTSFNTSGDTYQYDLPGSNTPPEASRNIELGAKLDLLDGRLSARFAVYQATKYNERNRDSPAGTPITDYLLSGKRHSAGVDIDIAGRITPQWEVFGSYAWIPVARIDAGNADGTTLTGELVGQRPSLTPRHSGTIWSTYQIGELYRVGAGLNARSSQTPNRNPAGIVAPSWVTADLLFEYTPTNQLALKLNVLNLTNKMYADSLYTAHYIQGAPRTLQLTVSTKF
ncbi:MAG: TonB-dependent siderophore receptor [Burkholderiales bacterium]|nr:TonB-dependent siderophore receptor [Burkholderiales bacterium]